jgi:SAM-dependent methyltransferase
MKYEPSDERLVVDKKISNKEDYLIYLIHEATYKYSLNYIQNKKVLDYGCGSGYGSALISDHCLEVIGIDISLEAISFAKKNYSSQNVSFLSLKKAEDSPLPFPDETFDVVLSFQVIEHIRDTTTYLEEMNRVLKPGGQILISTPNRSVRLFPFQKSWNMWHVKEYSQNQLYILLKEYFTDVKILQLGGQEDVIAIELKRDMKLKWLTLPFTLQFIPEFIRIQSLCILKYLDQCILRKTDKIYEAKFDDSAISISDSENICIDLIALANKKS